MQIPIELVAIFLGVWLTINAWQCREIIALKTAVAVIKTKLHQTKKEYEDET